MRDTIVHALTRAAAAHGDREFVNVDGVRISYREIDRRANAMARAFSDLNVAKGDRIVTLFETSIDVLVCWFAINKIGAVWVPINIAYKGEFLRHQVSDTGARLAICDPAFVSRLVDLADRLPELSLILCRGQDPLPDCAIALEALDRHRGSDDTPLPIDVTPSDLACLLYTSGTTGPSKGCMISHNFLCMQGRQFRRAIHQAPEETGWTCLPLFHGAAISFVVGALVEGLRVAVWPRFSVTSFWEDIESAGASNALLIASIMPLIADAPDTPAMNRCRGQLRSVFGVPMTADIRRIWQERFGVPFVSSWSYGQTEGVRLSMVEDNEIAPEGSAGRIAEEFEVAIVDNDDLPVADGEVGEIVYRPRAPNTMFEGYWHRPEETLHAWRNLWMHSGDLGRIEDGYLFFMDRAKDYLRSRGENISSFELEQAYSGHPAIREVAVHAVGAQSGEDEVKVTVVVREEFALTERELCLWSIDNLPHFAVPRYYEFRSELAKNPTGRVLKFQLREEGVTSATWDRESAGITVRRRPQTAA